MQSSVIVNSTTTVHLSPDGAVGLGDCTTFLYQFSGPVAVELSLDFFIISGLLFIEVERVVGDVVQVICFYFEPIETAKTRCLPQE